MQDEVPPKRAPKVVLSETSLDALADMEKKLILKAYSMHTVRNYTNNFSHFLAHFQDKSIIDLTKQDIENFIYQMIVHHKISQTKQNIMINSIKFYFESVLGKDRTVYDIQRPKKSQVMPNYLTKSEIKRLLETIDNVKHKAILCTIYSAGLRISELTKLRIDDIHSDEGYIFVKAAKNKKDRHTILSEDLLVLLRRYYKDYRPAYWLFEGRDGGQYSKSSIQKILRRAVKESEVSPWTTVHTLRHSFATHLVENSVNLRYIQTMLGHESPKTTQIYTKMLTINNKQFKSPLDGMLT